MVRLRDFDIETRFLWISFKNSSLMDVSEKACTLRDGDNVISKFPTQQDGFILEILTRTSETLCTQKPKKKKDEAKIKVTSIGKSSLWEVKGTRNSGGRDNKHHNNY
jgi:hypothetical protein